MIIHNSFRRQTGFTLMEIIIVIAILAIVATLLFLSNIFLQVKKARDSRRKIELAGVQRLMEDYYNDHGSYLTVDQASIDGLGCVTNPTRFAPYLPALPCDPQYPNHTYAFIADNSTYQKYRIYAQFENPQDPEVLKNPCGTSPYCVIGGKTFNYVIASPNVDLTSPDPPVGYIGPK